MMCECCGRDRLDVVRTTDDVLVCLDCWDSEGPDAELASPCVPVADVAAEASVWDTLDAPVMVSVADEDDDVFGACGPVDDLDPPAAPASVQIGAIERRIAVLDTEIILAADGYLMRRERRGLRRRLEALHELRAADWA